MKITFSILPSLEHYIDSLVFLTLIHATMCFRELEPSCTRDIGCPSFVPNTTLSMVLIAALVIHDEADVSPRG